MTSTKLYTPYEVPASALGDLSFERTDAEYEDMCRVRLAHHDEPASIKTLRAHVAMVKAARDAVGEAELAAMNGARKVQRDTGEHDGHLFAPFTVRDLSVAHFDIERRDEIRLPAILDDLVQRCPDEHRNHAHPFCAICRDDDAEELSYSLRVGCPQVDAKQCWAKAEMSLRRWLALNPGRSLPEVDDSWTPEGSESAGRKLYLSYDDLAELPEPEWLIKPILPDQSVVYLMGRDGTYKTFLALSMAMHLVRQGKPVLFIAGEGVRSFRVRIDAWLEHNSVEMTEDMKRCLDVRSQTVDLFEAGSDYAELRQRAEDRRYVLIVIDTLARSSGAAEQNSNSDMNLITQRVDALKAASGGTVLTVAHTDKGDNGIRGASAIGDNGDARLLMKRQGDVVTLSIDKMKDAADDFTKRLAPVQVGESIVLIDADQRPEAKILASSHSNENRVLVALGQLWPLGDVSQAEIRRVVGQDNSEKGPINDGTLSKVVSRLVRDGVVAKHPTRKVYKLNADDSRASQYLEALS